MTPTERIVRETIAEHLAIGIAEVTPEASIADDLGADSLDMIELVMAIEEEAGCTIEEEDLTQLNTVQDVINHVESLRGG